MRVKMLKIVRPDFYTEKPGGPKLPRLELKHDHIYPATSNQNGAICGVDEFGREVGVKPDEFELIFYGQEWCDFIGIVLARSIDIGRAAKGGSF